MPTIYGAVRDNDQRLQVGGRRASLEQCDKRCRD